MAPHYGNTRRSVPSGTERHAQEARSRQNFADMPVLRQQLPPPPYVPHGEPQTTQHLLELVDAKTRSTVHWNTSLVALYNFPQDSRGAPVDDPAVDRVLLRNLTGVCEPAMLCRLDVGDGGLYPRDSRDGYSLFITFSNLYLAPCIRVECLFKEESQEKEYLKLIIEFHFNPIHPGSLPITDFSWEDFEDGTAGHIEFTSRNVTCSGFGLVKKHQHMFDPDQHQMVSILNSLRDTAQSRKIWFEVHPPSGAAGFAELQPTRDRLPGGHGTLLASIGQSEYACFGPSQSEVAIEDLRIRSVGKLMLTNPPFPMVVMPCHDTFTTLKEFQVQAYTSTSIQYEEEKRALELWSSVEHTCAVYQVGNLDQPVLGVTFEDFPTLSSRRERSTYRLPNGLHSKIIFDIPGSGKCKLSAFQILDPPGLPPSDAYFVITTHQASWFNSWCNDPASSSPVTFPARFFPRCPKTTRNSQMATIYQLSQPYNRRWHRLLLNQDDALPPVDLTAGGYPFLRDEADIWINNWQKWNDEQKMAIETITRTKGGIMLVHGPAGTGKTLLQQALSIYFCKLGFHILALAPTNSNADQLTRSMANLEIADPNMPRIRFNRVYPASRDRGLDRLGADMFLDESEDDTIHEVRYILGQIRDHENHTVSARDFGLEQTVINEAETSNWIVFKEFPQEDGDMSEPQVFDVWQELRQCIIQMRQRIFNISDPRQRQMFKWSYEHCKAHIIRLSRYIITTTGNVRCTELMENFGRDENGTLDDCRGIIVFVDEACKDVEPNVWAGIVCEAWSTKVQGAIMLGDDKQLKPINKSARGVIEFNPYNSRLEISLPMRLVREGKPCIKLREQMRMHECIAEFPSRWIYDGRLINGPGTSTTLEEEKFGLQDVLLDIIGGRTAFDHLTMQEREVRARDHYIEVNGQVEYNDSRSKRVPKHADFFFDKIFPKLHDYFLDEMEDNVMVICAYSYSLSYWQAKANDIARQYSLPAGSLPKIVMLDSSQGMESLMVIFDGSMQAFKSLGFMEDPGRVNVALTRAKAVRWVIGGQLLDSQTYRPKLPILAEFKMEMDGKERVYAVVEPVADRMTTVVDEEVEEMLDY